MYNIVNSKHQTYTLRTNYDNLVSYEDVKEFFYKGSKETFEIETGVDHNNNVIYNLKPPTNIDQATNKGFVDNGFELNMGIFNNAKTELETEVYNKAEKTYVDGQLTNYV